MKIWDFGRIGVDTGADDHESNKQNMVLRPFERALTCSILIAGTQVMLVNAYFLRRWSWLRPESWTPRPWIQNSGPHFLDTHTHQRTYVENFSSLGAIPAEK
jgi:hypothetical protein